MIRTVTRTAALLGATLIAFPQDASAGRALYPSEVIGSFSTALLFDVATLSFGPGGAVGVSRDAGLSFGDLGEGQGDVTMSSRSQDRRSALRFWSDLRVMSGSDDLGREFDATNLRIGVDTELSPNWTVGVALGYGDIDGYDPPTAGNLTIEGEITYLQPYVQYQRGPWRAGLSVLVGRGDYDAIFGAPPLVPVETELTVWSLGLERDFALASGAVLTASLAHVDGRENETTTPPVLAAGLQSEFARSSLGIRYSSAPGAGGSFYAGLYADYIDSNATFSPPLGAPGTQEWSARVALGGSFAVTARSALDIGIEIGGIGGAQDTVAGSVMWQMRF